MQKFFFKSDLSGSDDTLFFNGFIKGEQKALLTALQNTEVN